MQASDRDADFESYLDRQPEHGFVCGLSGASDPELAVAAAVQATAEVRAREPAAPVVAVHEVGAAATVALGNLLQALDRGVSTLSRGGAPTHGGPAGEVRLTPPPTTTLLPAGAERAAPGEAATAPLLAARLALLRELLARPDQPLQPVLCAAAPLGHAWPLADRALLTDEGGARGALDELAALGLLQRTLHNRVHACPSCRRCQLNFRENCPACGSIALDIERLVHHFSCAYIGLEAEFVDGDELRCPKCRERLFQLGQDFERPHETYVCGGCRQPVDAPLVTAQCLSCGDCCSAREALVVDIHAYATTALTARAVELGRLTALDTTDLLFDPESRLARLDYLVLEARREFVRLRRHAGSLSLCLLRFVADGAPFPLFRSASARELRALGRRLDGSLRELDLVAPADAATLSVLLPETDEHGARGAMQRVHAALDDLCLRSANGRPLEFECTFHSWTEAPEPLDAALALVRGTGEGAGGGG